MAEIKTKTLDLKLGDRTVSLRLTVAAQLKLRNKFKEEAMQTIMSAAQDLEKTIAVFDEALSFKGNENCDMTGEELYDLLVDNGHGGLGDFAGVLFEIGSHSGVLSEKQGELAAEGITKEIDSMFENFGTNDENDSDITESEDETASFPKQEKSHS